MALEDGNCLERMCDVIGASEDRLLERVVEAVQESGLSRVPQAEQDWRDSIRGLSDAIFQAVYAVPHGYAEGSARTDPVIAYGIVRGRQQRSRGVRSADWHALLRHHRTAYVELVASAGFEEDEEEVCRRFVHRVFDRFERGFGQGHATARVAIRRRARPLPAEA